MEHRHNNGKEIFRRESTTETVVPNHINKNRPTILRLFDFPIGNVGGNKELSLHDLFGKNLPKVVVQECCELFLQENKEQNCFDEGKETLLHKAAAENCEGLCMLLSKKYKMDVDVCYRGYTPICYAVFNNSLECVQTLIKLGASLDLAIGSFENSILHFAILNRNLAIINSISIANPLLLLKKNLFGNTAVMQAISTQYCSDVFKSLLVIVGNQKHHFLYNLNKSAILGRMSNRKNWKTRQNCINEAFLMAASKDNFEAFDLLMEMNADLYCIDVETGDNLVHKMARYNSSKCLALLSDILPANSTYYDRKNSDNGVTALHLAVEKGNIFIVEMLLERCGANPNVSDFSGRNAWDKANEIKERYLVHDILQLLSSFLPTS